jgi:hypothetical protein
MLLPSSSICSPDGVTCRGPEISTTVNCCGSCVLSYCSTPVPGGLPCIVRGVCFGANIMYPGPVWIWRTPGQQYYRVDLLEAGHLWQSLSSLVHPYDRIGTSSSRPLQPSICASMHARALLCLLPRQLSPQKSTHLWGAAQRTDILNV